MSDAGGAFSEAGHSGPHSPGAPGVTPASDEEIEKIAAKAVDDSIAEFRKDPKQNVMFLEAQVCLLADELKKAHADIDAQAAEIARLRQTIDDVRRASYEVPNSIVGQKVRAILEAAPGKEPNRE